MVKWPKDNEPVSFEYITEPIVDAIQFAYEMKRVNKDKDIPYNGLDVGRKEAATCLRAYDQLSSYNLACSHEEQGRTALEEIVGLAVRLGIEQGRRIEQSSDIKRINEQLVDLALTYMKDVKREKDAIPPRENTET